MRLFAYALLLSTLLGSGWAAWFFFGHPKPDDVPAVAALKHQAADLETRVKAGDADAMVDLGWILIRMDSPIADPARAVTLFRAAAGKGSVRGQYALGWAYAKGRGVALDPHAASEWWRVAATAGQSAEAQFALGELYFNGRGVANDYGKAIEYYRMAAQRGHPVAQYLLGTMYQEGWGVERDPVEAFMWLTAALPNADRIRAYNPKFEPRRRREKVITELNRTQINEATRRAKGYQLPAPAVGTGSAN